MTLLPRGGLSFPLNPNQTGFDGIFVYYMSQLHSTEKICMLCSASHDIKWEKTQTWHHSSPHKRNVSLHNFVVELSVLKAMLDICSLKPSQCDPSTQRRNSKCILDLCYDAIYCKSHDTYSIRFTCFYP